MKVAWSLTSGWDRDRIYSNIVADNASAAATNDQKIADIEPQLAQFPNIGRPGRMPGTREAIVTGTPYIAIYRVEPTRVVILRVIHGAQQWPPRRRS